MEQHYAIPWESRRNGNKKTLQYHGSMVMEVGVVSAAAVTITMAAVIISTIANNINEFC